MMILKGTSARFRGQRVVENRDKMLYILVKPKLDPVHLQKRQRIRARLNDLDDARMLAERCAEPW